MHRQQGFTLVEVITVMLVLVAIASITVESSKDFVFQNRYDITKDRYEKIKKAIIGDSNQVINGQPNIEGFVKDMGRLPKNLHELIVKDYCDNNIISNQTNCTGNWIIQTAWTPPTATTLGYGWKGSYLSSSSNLKDGWGNGNAGDVNYGWDVKHYSNCPNRTVISNINSSNIDAALCMSIQSLGTPNVGNYSARYPDINNRLSIEESDWKVNVDGIQANVMASHIVGTCDSTAIDQISCPLAGGTWNNTNTPKCSVPTSTSKLVCDSAGGIFNYTTSDMCIRIMKNNKVYKSEGILVKIGENGREQLITFLSAFNDTNNDGIKDIGENMMPIGTALIGIYTNCNFTDKYHETIPPRLEIPVTMFPNTTLPTINW